MEDTARFALARDLMVEAGRLAVTYRDRADGPGVTAKGLQDLVTEADVAVEALVRGRLAEAFPDDGFLGEETGASDLAGAAGVWVLDPIDGTQPFVSGLASWCLSLAYLRDGGIRYGVVVNPPLDEVFEGGAGLPATVNGRPVSPHRGTSVTDGIVCVGYSPRIGPDAILPVIDRLLRRGGMYFRNGSGALTLCYVACGRLLGYVEPHINAWDCLAGIAIARSAGALTNDWPSGDALLAGAPIVAGPAAVFDELVAILAGE